MDQLTLTKVDSINLRFDLLNRCAGFIPACGNLKAALNLNPYLNEVLNANVNAVEYPDDKEYARIYDMGKAFDPHRLIVKGRPIKEYTTLYQNAMAYANLDDAEKQRTRKKDTYVIKEKMDQEPESFVRTEGHKEHDLCHAGKELSDQRE